MKRAVIYARVSTPEQATEDKTSLDDQEAQCRAYLDWLGGYKVVEVVRDEGVSGALFERPGIDRILQLAEAGEINAMVVAKTDRLARDVFVASLIKRSLKQRNAELLIVDRDLTTAAGEMMVNFEDVLAQWEKANIRDRLSRGLRNALKTGKIMGTSFSAYGYTYTKGAKVYEVDEAEAGWVLRMFQWIGEGQSLATVAKTLNAYAVPTKRGGYGWYATTVMQIIHNRMYVGEFGYYKNKRVSSKDSYDVTRTRNQKQPQADWLTVQVPAIISEELWNAAQETLQSNKRLSRRKMKLDYLLRGGMLVCGRCGYSYAGTTARNQRRVYRCGGIRPERAIKNGERCRASQVDANEIEEGVWLKVLSRLISLEESNLFEEDEDTKRQRQRDTDLLAAVTSMEIEIAQEEEKLVYLFTKGKLNEALYDKNVAALNERKRSIADKRVEIDERNQARDGRVADLQSLKELSWRASLLNDATTETKRKILDSLRTKVTLQEDGDLHIDGLVSDRSLAAFRAATQYADENPVILFCDTGELMSAQQSADIAATMISPISTALHTLKSELAGVQSSQSFEPMSITGEVSA